MKTAYLTANGTDIIQEIVGVVSIITRGSVFVIHRECCDGVRMTLYIPMAGVTALETVENGQDEMVGCVPDWDESYDEDEEFQDGNA